MNTKLFANAAIAASRVGSVPRSSSRVTCCLLRRERTALSFGRYGSVRADGNLLVFTRELGRERILVALNFGGEATTASLASGESARRLLLSSAGDREDEPIRGNVELRPHEGIVAEVSHAR
jgi:alpha-glucosidase